MMKALEEKIDAAQRLADMVDYQSRANHVQLGNVKAQSKENFNRITCLEQLVDDLQGRLRRTRWFLKAYLKRLKKNGETGPKVFSV